MKIKFTTYGKPPVILPKDDAEKMLRTAMDDSRVDLLLLNVLAGRPMQVGMKGIVFKMEAIDNES